MNIKVEEIRVTFESQMKNPSPKDLSYALCLENGSDDRNRVMYGGWFPWV
jgi:hypothetical protein